MALAEEIAFRGYAFQRFARAVGPAGAVLGFAALYAFLQALEPGASRASTAVAVALTILLSTAYLRTRALWVSWGINFGWKAIRALIFGFAVSGVNSHSPVVQGDPMGPFWLTGGGFGLDGSWLAFFVFLAAIPVVYRLTRELDYRYNTPEIIPGGHPRRSRCRRPAAARSRDGPGRTRASSAGPDCADHHAANPAPNSPQAPRRRRNRPATSSPARNPISPTIAGNESE